MRLNSLLLTTFLFFLFGAVSLSAQTNCQPKDCAKICTDAQKANCTKSAAAATAKTVSTAQAKATPNAASCTPCPPVCCEILNIDPTACQSATAVKAEQKANCKASKTGKNTTVKTVSNPTKAAAKKVVVKG